MTREKYDSICSKIGITPRDEQYDIIKQIYKNFTRGEKYERSLAILESPTGTGKTLAYLLAACEFISAHRKKVVISTYTRHLQTQAIEDFAKISSFYPKINIALLQGATNYISPIRVGFLMEKYQDNEKVYRLLEIIRDSAEKPEINGNLSLMDRDVIDELADEIDIEYLVSSDSAGHRDYYNSAKAIAVDADIVVTNHAFFVSNSLYSQLGASFSLDHVIVDEAHNLESVVTSTSRRSLAYTNLRASLKMLLLAFRREKCDETTTRKIDVALDAVNSIVRTLQESAKHDNRNTIFIKQTDIYDPLVSKVYKTFDSLHKALKPVCKIIDRKKFTKNHNLSGFISEFNFLGREVPFRKGGDESPNALTES